LKEFQKKFYVGPNFIVTGAGNLDHDTFVNATGKAFGGLSS
jgi:predicted Zn-dependent peptidase